MPPRHCLNWSVLQEFWHGPSLLPCRIEPSFFPGSSCHLHQKVNLFLFPVTAFITWKWLLWKILIKHWLFPGWTETEHFNYSIAQDFVLCAAALESVCMGVCAHVFCGGAVHSGCCCLCFTLQHFQQWLFWSWMCVADALHSAGFLLHAALSEGQGQQWWTPLRGQEEGGRKARLGRQMCGEEGLSLPGSREL